jgi:hypothetical protein
MRTVSLIRSLMLSVLLLGFSGATLAQIGIAVSFGPPAIPVYEQPICPGEGYMWTPGYWGWSGERHVWVRGRPIAQRDGYRFFSSDARQFWTMLIAPIPVRSSCRTMRLPRLNEGRQLKQRLGWCEPGVVSGQPCQGRSARCGQLGHSLEPRSGKPDTARGVRASMDCPTTTEPGVGCPAPSLLKTDTRGTRSSGRNGACASGWPAQLFMCMPPA